MPELPEVETVRAALAPVMTGARIVSVDIRRPDLRWPLPTSLYDDLHDKYVSFVGRRAKIIVIAVEEKAIMLHLGMSGSVRISSHKPNTKPHDHIELQVLNGQATHYITLNDPRRFGYVDSVLLDDLSAHPSMSQLGPEPVAIEDQVLQVGDIVDLPYINQALAQSKAPIKSFLLDQRQIAGLGNIYVCEALHRAGISPKRKAYSVKGARAARLLPAIQKVLEEAILQGGTSLRDHKQPDGKLGYFVQSLLVYGRDGEPCTSCKTPIKAIVQSGRTSFYCPQCQR